MNVSFCFNGAALFRARRCRRALLPVPTCSASTEPRSFERGDNGQTAKARALTKLQRSRALSSAEMAALGLLVGTSNSLQRSRALSSAEMVHARRREGRDLCFNGAALFRARRLVRPVLYDINGFLLQRSRALSSAEIPLVLDRRGDEVSFNGAALFRARRFPSPPTHATMPNWLQRSRALSSAEISTR